MRFSVFVYLSNVFVRWWGVFNVKVVNVRGVAASS